MKKMRKYRILLLVIVVVATMMSCGNKDKKSESREERIAEFRSELTSEDTLTMLRMCDDAMELLKQKRIDEVLASLYEYTDSTEEVKPLTEATAAKYRKRLKLFPVLDYTRKYYSFQLEGCNDVKYEVTFATAEQAGTKEPARTAFMFNPVKVDGTWKLCVKTADEEIDMQKR